MQMMPPAKGEGRRHRFGNIQKVLRIVLLFTGYILWLGNLLIILTLSKSGSSSFPRKCHGGNTPKNLVVDSEMALALTDAIYMVADRLDGLLHP